MRYEAAAALLPEELRRAALTLPPPLRFRAEELRLRAGRPMTALTGEEERPLPATVTPRLLEELSANLYQRALENREARTWAATTLDEVKKLAAENTGYIKTMWCGDEACEEKMKEEAGLSSRCMPFEQEQLSDVCPCCGKPAKVMVYWGKAY